MEPCDPSPTPGPERLLDLARAATGEQAYSDAVDYYQRYLELRPDDLQARLACARVLSWAESYGRAINLYKALHIARPFDRELSLERARVLLWAGRYNEAIVALLALQADLANPAPGGTGLEPSLTGRTRSLSELRTRVTRALADGYAWSGQVDKALSLYNSIWRENQADSRVGLALARLLTAVKDYPAALGVYETLLSLPDADNDLRLERARVLFWAGRYAETIDALLALRDSAPHEGATSTEVAIWRTEVTRLLASAYAWSGNLEGYRDIVTEHPQDRGFRLEYARALQREGRLNEAARQYEAYLELVPGDLEVMLEHARVLLWSGAYARAVRACLALKSSLADASRCATLNADRCEAVRDETERLLAHALLWGGEAGKALPVIRRLVARHPEEAGLELDRAHALGQLGEIERARGAIVAYREKGGAPGNAAVAEGELLEWQGGVLKARARYRQALRDPASSAEAVRKLAGLEPSLQRVWEGTWRWRADVDGFSRETLRAAGRVPVGLVWMYPRVTVARFHAGGAVRHRVTPVARVSYWHTARWTFAGEGGVAYQDGPGTSAPVWGVSSRWSPRPGRFLVLGASAGDADERLFTWPALVDRVRRRDLALTGDWQFSSGRWESWTLLRTTRLFTAAGEHENRLWDAQTSLERVALELRSGEGEVRLGTTGGLLHAATQDEAYWTPRLYGTVGLRGRILARWPGGAEANLAARVGVAYSTEVSAAFPEVSVEGAWGCPLGERFSVRVEGAWGQTVRNPAQDASEDSWSDVRGTSNYGVGHVMGRLEYRY